MAAQQAGAHPRPNCSTWWWSLCHCHLPVSAVFQEPFHHESDHSLVDNYDWFLWAGSAFSRLMCCYAATREVLRGEREGISRHRCEKHNCSPSKLSQKAATAASAKTGKSRHYVVLAKGVFTCYVWVLEPMSTSLLSGSGLHRRFVQSVLEKCPLHCIGMSCTNVNRHGAAPTLLLSQPRGLGFPFMLALALLCLGREPGLDVEND